jgi:Uma2 family endonuclease
LGTRRDSLCRRVLMGLPLKVTTASGDEPREPYMLRVAGWTENRYFNQASETRIVEFEDGELVMHSPAGVRHQRIVRFLTVLLSTYVRSRGLGDILNGPAVVRLRPGLDYEPDVFFGPTAQLRRFGDQYFSGPPALVVEVVSAGTRRHDLQTKAANYHEHRVKEYWAVDVGNRTLVRHRHRSGAATRYGVTRHTKGRVASSAIPGFWLDVSWLWQEPLPAELECVEQIRGARRR